jgi:hypothetical protein
VLDLVDAAREVREFAELRDDDEGHALFVAGFALDAVAALLCSKPALAKVPEHLIVLGAMVLEGDAGLRREPV